VVEGREGYRWRHQSELEVVVEENPPLGEHDSSSVARFLALSRFKIFLTRDVLLFREEVERMPGGPIEG